MHAHTRARTHTHKEVNKLHTAACTLAHARRSEHRGEKSGLNSFITVGHFSRAADLLPLSLDFLLEA